ncbi:MAG TPA: D-alanyl-D-alanine carboxypeptidase/D-alanyl-D-alanine-endopeptidase [Vicinamibacterales bacterium]
MAALAATAACHASAHPAATIPGTTASVAALQRDVDAVLADPVLSRGTWGVLVRSLTTGDTLYSVNARKLLMPASNMKLVTLAAAAEHLGWDFTYETRVLATAPVVDGELTGDLVVVGSGDPSIGLVDGSSDRVFGEWADRLKQLGVRRIGGHIVGDDTAFERRTLGFGWSWDDLPDDYAAGVGALQFNENAVRVLVSPGPAIGSAAAVRVEPPGAGISVTSAARTAAAGSATSLFTRRLPGQQRLEISGSIALDAAAPAMLDVSVDDGTLFFVEALRRFLIARGIDVRGQAGAMPDGPAAVPVPSATLVASHRSPPLATLAIRLMKVSQNQYAETFLKTLSVDAGGHEATAEGGRRVAQQIFDRWGIDGAGLILRDGSGLSRYDYVTAEALIGILSHVYHDERLRGPFEASLPAAGSDGTLGNRLKGTAAEGRIHAKTGSMSNVRALSGFATTADGEPLAFSIIANNFDTTPAVINRATDAIVVRLAQFHR